MRTIIEVPDDVIAALDRVALKESVSRAALVRIAIDDLLAKKRPDDDIEDFAGLWATKGIDGLAYQEELRSEW